MKQNIPLSVLDLMPVLEGRVAADTFHNSAKLAQFVEQAGYKRYWLAEHHNMESVASSATSVLIGFIAGSTATIRVGSGGIMLPNHAPLVIAEQFGTLASLYPHRIDMGLGRAPGTDQLTAMALRRNSNGSDFYEEIQELSTYLSAENKNGRVRAIPGEGLDIPMWILGSSTDSAYLAARLGLPYAFASHFAPTYLHAAIRIYRENFQPSAHLQQPYVLTCVNVIVADTTAHAEYIATSYYQLVTGIISGKRRPLPPPVSSMNGIWTPQQESAVRQMATYAFVGDRETVKAGLQDFIDTTVADELMAVSHLYDPLDKLRSYELLAELGLTKAE